MYRSIAIIIVLAAVAPLCQAWSRKGHQVTAYIAKRHLTPATAAAVDALLDGDNIVYWASWLDTVRDDPQYSFTSTWHYINVEAGKTVDDRYYEPAGDAIHAIEAAMGGLVEEDTPDSEKVLGIKILVHVVGDLHQPLHDGHKSDYGGNSIYLTFMGESTNLHSMWDYYIVEAAHNWSYYQWAENIDRVTPTVQAQTISGSVIDWAAENVAIAAEIYDAFPRYSRVTATDVAAWTPAVEDRLLCGGLRLAHLLNLAFDPAYDPTDSGVDDLRVDPAADAPVDVYSVDGSLLRHAVDPASAVQGLPRGIYIAGQRKIAVCH